MCGHIRKDKIINEDIQHKVGVASMVNKTRETRLRWFGYVKRKGLHAPMRRYETLDIVDTMKDRSKLNKYWEM